MSERDPAKHNEMRKYLSSAFSDRALKEQEHLVALLIDRFIEEIGTRGMGPSGLNMTSWFNLLTFDVITELAFGESFNGIESGNSIVFELSAH